jgi:DNA polymerase III subunit chi
VSRVDFYRLTRDPAVRVVPVLAERVLAQGDRLVVAADAALHPPISEALWAHKADAFLAHGPSGGAAAHSDPVLLADDLVADPPNGAAMAMIADGVWRDAALGFLRTFFLFDNSRIDDARSVWRTLGNRDGVERHFWKQDDRGRWTEGP